MKNDSYVNFMDRNDRSSYASSADVRTFHEHGLSLPPYSRYNQSPIDRIADPFDIRGAVRYACIVHQEANQMLADDFRRFKPPTLTVSGSIYSSKLEAIPDKNKER